MLWIGCTIAEKKKIVSTNKLFVFVAASMTGFVIVFFLASFFIFKEYSEEDAVLNAENEKIANELIIELQKKGIVNEGEIEIDVLFKNKNKVRLDSKIGNYKYKVVLDSDKKEIIELSKTEEYIDLN